MLHQVLLGCSSQGGWGGQSKEHAWVSCLAYKILVGKPEGKRPLTRPRHGSENDVRMYLGERGWELMDWIHLAQDED